jgi:phosphate/sulfate permease
MVVRAIAVVVAGAAVPACAGPLFALGVVVAIGIGMSNAGNDLCNAMGVTVGAGVLSLRQAVVIGALFDGLGGLLMGSRVTNTIAGGIVKRSLYTGVDGPDLLAKSMLVVMGSGALTMLTGTLARVPISAHHSVVGSLVAMALLTRGPEAVEWWLVGEIVFSWIGNPLLGMACSMATFTLIDVAILSRPSPAAAFGAHKWLIYTLSVCTCLPFVLVKSPQLHVPLPLALAASCALGLACAFYSDALAARLAAANAYARAGGMGPTPASSDDDEVVQPQELRSFASFEYDEEEEGPAVACVRPANAAAGSRGRGARGAEGGDDADGGSESTPIIAAKEGGVPARTGAHAPHAAAARPRTSSARLSEIESVESSFSPLLLLSAVSVAFVHGAQDVSNSAGPLMQLNAVLAGGAADGTDGQWPLLLAVCAFVAGDLTLGWRVIGTVGSEITDMTPSRAFAAQMGTVVALTSATIVALPVSSSECIIGSVVGVGLAKRYLGYVDGGVELKVLKRIFTAWVLTIPYAGLLAAMLFTLINLGCPLPRHV